MEACMEDLCASQMEALTCPPPPGKKPRAFEFLKKMCSNSPLTGPNSLSNTPPYMPSSRSLFKWRFCRQAFPRAVPRFLSKLSQSSNLFLKILKTRHFGQHVGPPLMICSIARARNQIPHPTCVGIKFSIPRDEKSNCISNCPSDRY